MFFCLFVFKERIKAINTIMH